MRRFCVRAAGTTFSTGLPMPAAEADAEGGPVMAGRGVCLFSRSAAVVHAGSDLLLAPTLQPLLQHIALQRSHGCTPLHMRTRHVATRPTAATAPQASSPHDPHTTRPAAVTCSCVVAATVPDSISAVHLATSMQSVYGRPWPHLATAPHAAAGVTSTAAVPFANTNGLQCEPACAAVAQPQRGHTPSTSHCTAPLWPPKLPWHHRAPCTPRDLEAHHQHQAHSADKDLIHARRDADDLRRAFCRQVLYNAIVWSLLPSSAIYVAPAALDCAAGTLNAIRVRVATAPHTGKGPRPTNKLS